MRTRWFAFAALLALSGCETLSYYAQAVGGQFELMRKAQPVSEWIADPATPAALRARLELAERMRAFASRELELPDNGSYRSYARLDRPYVVWNVFAAPEFSVTPIESCFPVAGCVDYRGFFARADAERYAAELRAKGLDVFSYGVPAYSTLGWFRDPVLSTQLRRSDTEIAAVMFHELAHNLTLNAPAGFRYGGKVDGNANACFGLAKLYLGQKKLPEALDYAQRDVAKNPKSAAAHNLLGVILNQMTKYAEAAASFENALRLAPGDLNVSINLGVAYINSRQYVKAREIYEKVLPKIEDPELKEKVEGYLKLIKDQSEPPGPEAIK